MVSASFRYSDFDIYCTEINVILEPSILSDHSCCINPIAPGPAKILRSTSTRPRSTAPAPGGVALPRTDHWRPPYVCNPFNHSPACGDEQPRHPLSDFQRLLAADRAPFR